MKKLLLFIIIMVSCLTLLAQPKPKVREKHKDRCNASDSLVLFWSSRDPEVFKKVVFPYSLNSKKQEFWQYVEVLIWGPSTKLLTEDEDLQEKIKQLKDNGVVLTSCKWCADQYNASEILTGLGVDVKYMGKPLTKYLKSGRKVLVF
jgi:hypothetical protein